MNKYIFSVASLAIISLLFLTSCSLWIDTTVPTDTKSREDMIGQAFVDSTGQSHWLSTHEWRNKLKWNRGMSSWTMTWEVNASRIVVNSWITSNEAISTKMINKTITYAVPWQRISTVFKVWLTENDIITSITATTNSHDRHDQQYHNRFNQSATTIIGKKVSDIKNLATLWWASLTTHAFLQVVQEL